MMIDVSVQSKRMTKSPKVWGMNVGARLRERILERGPNLVARRRIWFMLSALAVATAALGIGVRGVEYGWSSPADDSSNTRSTVPSNSTTSARISPPQDSPVRSCNRQATTVYRCESTNSKPPRNKPSPTP